jgi:hypothetical protein
MASVDWTPWERCKRSEAESGLREAWVNNLYDVAIFDGPRVPGLGEFHLLRIGRRDFAHVHDWRDLQRIKNDLVGQENEGVELYPKQSRLLDTGNRYWLWVLKDPERSFRFGSNVRLVHDDSTGRQRTFDLATQPDDLHSSGSHKKAVDTYIGSLRWARALTAAGPAEFVQARQRLEALVQQYPNQYEFYDALGGLCARMNDRSGEARVVEDLYHRFRNDLRTRINYAFLCMRREKFDEVPEIFDHELSAAYWELDESNPLFGSFCLVMLEYHSHAARSMRAARLRTSGRGYPMVFPDWVRKIWSRVVNKKS